MYNLFLNNDPHLIVDNIDVQKFGLCVMERPDIPSPERQQIFNENKYSQRGSRRVNVGWGDIDIKVKLNYLDTNNDGLTSFRKEFYNMRKAMFEAKTIRFNDDIPVEYEVKNVSISDTTSEILEHGIFTVTFTCSPFPYKIDDFLEYSVEATGGKTFYIINDGNYPCFPKITFKCRPKEGVSSTPPNTISIVLRNLSNSSDVWNFTCTNGIKFTNSIVIDNENAVIYFKYDTGVIEDAWKYCKFDDFTSLEPNAQYALVLNSSSSVPINLTATIDRRMVY